MNRNESSTSTMDRGICIYNTYKSNWSSNTRGKFESKRLTKGKINKDRAEQHLSALSNAPRKAISTQGVLRHPGTRHPFDGQQIAKYSELKCLYSYITSMQII